MHDVLLAAATSISSCAPRVKCECFSACLSRSAPAGVAHEALLYCCLPLRAAAARDPRHVSTRPVGIKMQPPTAQTSSKRKKKLPKQTTVVLARPIGRPLILRPIKLADLTTRKSSKPAAGGSGSTRAGQRLLFHLTG